MKRTDYLVKYLLLALLVLLVLLVNSLLLQPSAAQNSNARLPQPPRAARTVSPSPTPAPSPSPTRTPLPRAYLDAVRDAQTAEPQEISRNLVAITETEAGLRWQGAGDDRRVLVVTWTNYQGYKGKEGQHLPLPSIWVTTVPELKNFCGRLPRAFRNRTLRLEQLLGLPPGKGNTIFVEMWIKPADLFRPSPDPEIIDHEAVLFPPTSRFLEVKPEHTVWFDDWRQHAYTDAIPYPWTRLGYTYDWGNRRSEVGLSEFVAVKDTDAIVESVKPTLDYCRTTKRRR